MKDADLNHVRDARFFRKRKGSKEGKSPSKTEKKKKRHAYCIKGSRANCKPYGSNRVKKKKKK